MTSINSDEIRILIADDDAVASTVLKHHLTAAGYTVSVVGTGEACLSMASSWQPTLVVLDVMMPGVHGIEVLRQIKANPETTSIGVIVCTSKTYKSDHQTARDHGAFEVIAKPFEKAVLLNAIGRFLSGGTHSGDDTAASTSTGAEKPCEPYLPVIPYGRPYIRFWGTRGSIPVSGPEYVRHGGDTSCVEIGCGDDLMVIDAGSGIRALGKKLAGAKNKKNNLFITHTHWDHIQGFPFFIPAYLPDHELTIYSAAGFGKDLKSVLQGQLDRDYFPVQFEDMRARFEFRTLTDEPLRVGPFKVTWHYTQHPAATVGYKIEVGGKKVAYVSDNEFLMGYKGSPTDSVHVEPALKANASLISFLTGVDLLVHEAQYTNAEYQNKVGWGHTCLSNACLLVHRTRVKRWIIPHHDPVHHDCFLDEKLNVTREILRQLDASPVVTHAYDGMTEYL